MARLPLVTALATAFLVFIAYHLSLPFSQTLPSFGDILSHYSLHFTWLPFCRSTTDSQQDGTGATTNGTMYLLGLGKADITGPVVEINLMGYADPGQVGSGLRQRLYARAFIIGSINSANWGEDRFVYLVLDTQSGDTAVRYGILDELRKLAEKDWTYEVYGQHNVAVTGTHSHSGPGAWLNYLLPQITSKGFDKQSYEAIVQGAVLSIKRAHDSCRPGYLSVGYTDIEDGNSNRSPFAYLANLKEERKRYKHDVEKTMTVLHFMEAGDVSLVGGHRGVLTWYPVHGTSLYGNNTLISGDNKGVAAWMFEQAMKEDNGAEQGFVAGFSQANVGDTSPNVLGAWCEDGSGEMCDFKDSTCGGKNEPCHGRGPEFTKNDRGAASCYEIGRRQYEGAKRVYRAMDEIGTPIQGSVVKSVHSFQNLSDFTFSHPNTGQTVRTCPAALGYSFAAGTTDGPGAFDFKQADPGKPNANPLWAVVSGALKEPSEEQKACHAPKPILLDVGEIHDPYQWTPNIVDIQLLRVGQLIIIVSPGEATTMSGRRWKRAIHDLAESTSLTEDLEPVVVLGGPANSYTHYIATEEEYGVQRYEGASTLYGPHTLDAFIELNKRHLPYLSADNQAKPESGPYPENNVNRSLSFIMPVVFDRAPFFKSFGDVLEDVNGAYMLGEKVTATFVAANPRNDLRLEETYAAVEQHLPNGTWRRVRDDADWNLVSEWRRTSTVLATSEVRITWEIAGEQRGERFRLRYYGASKGIGGGIEQFEGVSGAFEIV